MNRSISIKKRLLSLLLAVTLVALTACAHLTPSDHEFSNSAELSTESSAGGSTGAPAENSTENSTDSSAETSTESSPEASTEIPTETSTEETAPAPDEQERFSAFTKDLFLETILSNTINLHYTLSDPESFGITEYPVSFGTLDLWTEQDILNDLDELSTELHTYDYTVLTEEQQMTYDLLSHYIDAEREAASLYLYSEPFGIFTGATTQIPITLAEYSFYREQDIRDYLELLPQLKSYFEYLISIEQLRADAGLFMTEATLEANLDGCESFLKNPENNYLLTSFASRMEEIDWLNEQTKNDYLAQNQSIVTESVFPAFEYLADALESLRARCSADGGLATLPEGKAYFQYLMDSRLGTDRTVEEMLELILTYQRRQLQRMYALLSRNPSLETSLNQFSFSMTDPEQILNYLKTAISEDYPEIPDTSYTIRYVEKELEEVLSPAFYMIPPLDLYQENTIYINNGYLDETSLFSTLAHEGYPGHLYQNVYFNSKNSEPLRSVFSYLGYSEGWATYVEYEAYAYDQSVDSALLEVMALNSSVTLSIYAALDIYINYEGWTRAQAAEYLTQFFGDRPDVFNEIYNSIAGDPCYYLAYHGGYLEILEMRAIAESTLGDRFDLKEFHRFFLDLGECPFSLANQRLAGWLEEQ